MWNPFDFNHDGKVDPTEEYLAYKIWEEMTREEEEKEELPDNPDEEDGEDM